MLYFVMVISIFLFIAFVAIPLVVLLHKLGQSLMAIRLTQQKVDMYLGTYGSAPGNKHIELGKLNIWFTPNPFFWHTGLCVAAANTPLKHKIIFILSGSFMPLLVAVFIAALLFVLNAPDFIKIMSAAFLLISTFNVMYSLVPDKHAILMTDGYCTYNDGQLIARMRNYIKFLNAYPQIGERIASHKYHEALELLEPYMKVGTSYAEVFRKAIEIARAANDTDKQLEIYQKARKTYGLNADEYNGLGMTLAIKGNIDEAYKAFDKAVNADETSALYLNNKAFCSMVKEDYLSAIADFDQCVLLDVDTAQAYSYANRGLAKIMAGYIVEGLADIDQAKTLDANEPYIYRSLGIYYLNTGNKTEALHNLGKAKQLNAETYLVDDLITKAVTIHE